MHIFGLKNNFSSIWGIWDGDKAEEYRAKFGMVIEAMQYTKVSFIPAWPITMLGPNGISEAVSLKHHVLPIDDFGHMVSAIRRLIPPGRLCFLSPSNSTRREPVVIDDHNITVFLYVGPTKEELVAKELQYFYDIKKEPQMHFIDPETWFDEFVSVRTWLQANPDFLQPAWKDFPELDKNL